MLRVSRTDLSCGPAQREDRAAPALRGRLAGLFRNANTGSVTIPWSGFQPDHDGALALHEGRQVGVATSARGGSIVFGAHDPDLLVRLDSGGSVVVEIDDGVTVDLAALLGGAPAPVRADAVDLEEVRRDVRAAMLPVEPIAFGRHDEPLRGRSDDDGAREDADDAGSKPCADWPHVGEGFAPLERLAGDARPSAPVPSGLSRSDYGLPASASVQIKAVPLRERLGADRSRAEEILAARRGAR